MVPVQTPPSPSLPNPVRSSTNLLFELGPSCRFAIDCLQAKHNSGRFRISSGAITSDTLQQASCKYVSKKYYSFFTRKRSSLTMCKMCQRRSSRSCLLSMNVLHIALNALNLKILLQNCCNIISFVLSTNPFWGPRNGARL